jgi:hypothetical protein
MYPWQLDILDKLSSVETGELRIMMTGRRVGKSTFSGQAFQRLWDDIHQRPVENLIISEGTVYGARYYTVEPVGGNWLEMEAWCYETFGDDTQPIWGESEAPEPAQRWYKNAQKFWFLNEQDLTMFVLKWR